VAAPLFLETVLRTHTFGPPRKVRCPLWVIRVGLTLSFSGPGSSPSWRHAASELRPPLKAYLAPRHRTKWFVYSKRPFAGPEQVLAYLSHYTHRVAISNSRLIVTDATGATFSYKDYRIEGPGRYKTMTLKPDKFIRWFLMHVLPNGFHRIRHCGLLACGTKTETIARIRELIAAVAPVQTAHQPQAPDSAAATDQATHPCPCCGVAAVA
jgi:hypothetical protein